jgi:hypothetical protein
MIINTGTVEIITLKINKDYGAMYRHHRIGL